MKLANYVTFNKLGDKFLINYGTNQVMTEDFKFFNQLTKLSYFYKKERNSEEVNNFLLEEGISQDVLSFMLDKKMLIEDAFDRSSYYSRNELYYNLMFGEYNKLQKNIMKSKVLVIGAGGIGNFVATTLLGFNVKKITLIDGDTIENHNLNRQFLFTNDDIGRYKVEVIKESLDKKGSNTNIEIKKSFLNENVLLTLDTDYDLILACADEKKALKLINAFAVNNKIPMLNIGYLNDISVIGPVYIPNKTACAECNTTMGVKDLEITNKELEERIDFINKDYVSPSSMTNNLLAAAMASNEIVNILGKNYENLNSYNRRIGISNIDLKLMEIGVKKNEDCKLCSKAK